MDLRSALWTGAGLAAGAAGIVAWTYFDQRSAPPIPWMENVDAAVARAEAEGKPLLLHFASAECGWCRKMEGGAFADPRVRRFAVGYFVPVRIDVDADPATAEEYRVTTVPATHVALGPESIMRQQGHQEAEEFLRWMRRADTYAAKALKEGTGTAPSPDGSVLSTPEETVSPGG